jgi:hypothetical protein
MASPTLGDGRLRTPADGDARAVRDVADCDLVAA